MSLWGNSDGVALTGTVAINQNAVAMTGSSTAFTTEVDIGDLLLIDDLPYRVATITSNTALTITEAFAPSNVTGKTATKRETPRHLSVAESDAIYGISTTTNVEHTGGADNVVEVAVDSGGSGYVDAADAAVTIPAPASGTQATGTAVVAAGKVTSITITNVGAGYTASDSIAVTIHGATPASFDGSSASIVDVANNRIALSDAQVDALAIDDAVVYNNGSGGADIGGLVDGTTYYIKTTWPGPNKIELKAAVSDVDEIDLTAVGASGTAHTLTGATATAVASLGSGSGSGANVAGPGWVKRTAGTGGRAGRVQYETLVAMSSITGDTADDLEFPE